MTAQDADIVDEIRSPAEAAAASPLQVQPSGFLIQLSLDWIVLRASENIDDFLGESHVTLIDEPLGRFVQAQALHDLRNQFARLSGSTGVARAYRVRLTHDRPRVDIAFQVSRGRVLLEGVPSPERGLGATIGSVGGLVDGLSGTSGEDLIDAAARRVRALTGYDHSILIYRDGSTERSAHSSRGGFGAPGVITGLPAIVADTAADPVPIFPRKLDDASLADALTRAPSAEALEQLRNLGIGSALSLTVRHEGRDVGVIQCHSRSGRAPNLELHAAAELFTQLLALRLEVDRLRS